MYLIIYSEHRCTVKSKERWYIAKKIEEMYKPVDLNFNFES